MDFDGPSLRVILRNAEEYNKFGLTIHELLLSNGFKQNYYDQYYNADNSILVDSKHNRLFYNREDMLDYSDFSLECILNKLKKMLKVEELNKCIHADC